MAAPAVDRFEPHRYPWPTVRVNVMLLASGTRPLTLAPGGRLGAARVRPSGSAASVPVDELLAGQGVAPVGSRALVVAVGSNASPDVLRHKFARSGRDVSPTTPLVAGTVTGIGVGHSAHVSRRGYVAAAPYADPRARCRLTVSLLDEAQVAAIDATEPNYRRVLLSGRDHPLELDSGERPEAYYLYVSVHGVLADPFTGRPTPRRTQGSLHRWLAATTREAVFGGEPARVAGLLGRGEEQERLRRLFGERGMVRGAGLATGAGPAPSSATRRRAP